jgi:HSP20 family protein
VLIVSGERKRPQVRGRVYQQMEIEVGPFQRQVRLAEDVDPSRATASLEQGVLTIELPVVEDAPLSGSFTIEVWRRAESSGP